MPFNKTNNPRLVNSAIKYKLVVSEGTKEWLWEDFGVADTEACSPGFLGFKPPRVSYRGKIQSRLRSYFEISKYRSCVSVYRDDVCEQIMISNTRHLLLGVNAGNATSVMQESELGDPQNRWVHFPSCPPTPAALFQMIDIKWISLTKTGALPLIIIRLLFCEW